MNRHTISVLCSLRRGPEACFVFPVSLPRASWARGKRRNGGNPNAQSAFLVASPFRRRAAYGNRTRLLGLGSRCTTDVLMPQKKLFRLQKYNIFFNCARKCTQKCIFRFKITTIVLIVKLLHNQLMYGKKREINRAAYECRSICVSYVIFSITISLRPWWCILLHRER